LPIGIIEGWFEILFTLLLPPVAILDMLAFLDTATGGKSYLY
jgi:uncharacterized membrane protein YqaE (UPF0057 family)